jgi:5-methylcytosine-specific restriction endonuclease McrA
LARPSGPKTRAGNQWTEAKFRSFIRGNLRRTSQKWPPISNCLKKARVTRGEYLCAGCKEIVPASTRDESGKRIKNVHVDHINPVIDPAVGWVSYDSLIERMFVEEDGLQVLCDACHKIKTDKEKAIAKERRLGENDIEEF